MSAPRKALIVTVALTLSVIGLKFLVPLVAPIIPADRPHEFANGLGIRLLSIGHEGNRVTWYNEIRNGTGSDITLNLTSTCRHGRPPQESGPSGTSLEGAESIVIP